MDANPISCERLNFGIDVGLLELEKSQDSNELVEAMLTASRYAGGMHLDQMRELLKLAVETCCAYLYAGERVTDRIREVITVACNEEKNTSNIIERVKDAMAEEPAITRVEEASEFVQNDLYRLLFEELVSSEPLVHVRVKQFFSRYHDANIEVMDGLLDACQTKASFSAPSRWACNKLLHEVNAFISEFGSDGLFEEDHPLNEQIVEALAVVDANARKRKRDLSAEQKQACVNVAGEAFFKMMDAIRTECRLGEGLTMADIHDAEKRARHLVKCVTRDQEVLKCFRLAELRLVYQDAVIMHLSVHAGEQIAHSLSEIAFGLLEGQAIGVRGRLVGRVTDLYDEIEPTPALLKWIQDAADEKTPDLRSRNRAFYERFSEPALALMSSVEFCRACLKHHVPNDACDALCGKLMEAAGMVVKVPEEEKQADSDAVMAPAGAAAPADSDVEEIAAPKPAKRLCTIDLTVEDELDGLEF